jgi:O-methyltransferase involved in polyketide biosynthesis
LHYTVVTTQRVRLTKEKETMLGTLYARALESRSADPILRDAHAERVVGLIDYDFRRLGVNRNLVLSVALRARQFDTWASSFLTKHANAVVLHLGCGLDSRIYRVDPPPTVDWFDVDYPDVIELRRRLYPKRPGYTMVGTSVTAPEWLEQVPNDRPSMVVAEGLTMYLQPQNGVQLLRRLVDHLPTGEMAFDVFSRVAVRLGVLNPVVRASGARLAWGIDDFRELEAAVPGLHVIEVLRAYDLVGPGLERLAPGYRFALRLMKRIPAMGNLGRLARFRF